MGRHDALVVRAPRGNASASCAVDVAPRLARAVAERSRAPTHARWRDPKAQAGRLYCVRASAPSVSFAVEPEYLMGSSYALMGFSLLTKGAPSLMAPGFLSNTGR